VKSKKFFITKFVVQINLAFYSPIKPTVILNGRVKRLAAVAMQPPFDHHNIILNVSETQQKQRAAVWFIQSATTPRTRALLLCQSAASAYDGWNGNIRWGVRKCCGWDWPGEALVFDDES